MLAYSVYSLLSCISTFHTLKQQAYNITAPLPVQTHFYEDPHSEECHLQKKILRKFYACICLFLLSNLKNVISFQLTHRNWLKGLRKAAHDI